ncbi:hypothetical protein BDW59DRAFT_117123 [Aspergillus cavernicola]|uniref:Uncharacterized protein n=1 Tax=Aspergillus cavernicola TaxID=176166 RepID=A0ABR4HYD9_9EURO
MAWMDREGSSLIRAKRVLHNCHSRMSQPVHLLTKVTNPGSIEADEALPGESTPAAVPGYKSTLAAPEVLLPLSLRGIFLFSVSFIVLQSDVHFLLVIFPLFFLV